MITWTTGVFGRGLFAGWWWRWRPARRRPGHLAGGRGRGHVGAPGPLSCPSVPSSTGRSRRPPPPGPGRSRWVRPGAGVVLLVPFLTSCQKECPIMTRSEPLTRSIVLEGAHAGHRRGTVDRAGTCQARLAACTCLTASDSPLLTGSSAALARLSRYLGICYPRGAGVLTTRDRLGDLSAVHHPEKSRADSGTTGSRWPAGSGRPSASPCRLSSSAATWPAAQVVSRRWVVERTIGWLMRDRRRATARRRVVIITVAGQPFGSFIRDDGADRV